MAQGIGEDGSGHATGASRERPVLIAVLAITAGLFVAAVVAGLAAESSALLAESIDMLVDSLVFIVALTAVGATAQGRRRSARHIGWLQVTLAGLVILEVTRRALQGSDPQPTVMLIFGALAMLAKAVTAILLTGVREAGVHVRSAWIFSVNDAVANLGVILAGALVAVTGSAWPDLAMGVAIVVLIGAGAWRILAISRE